MKTGIITLRDKTSREFIINFLKESVDMKKETTISRAMSRTLPSDIVCNMFNWSQSIKGYAYYDRIYNKLLRERL